MRATPPDNSNSLTRYVLPQLGPLGDENLRTIPVLRHEGLSVSVAVLVAQAVLLISAQVAIGTWLTGKLVPQLNRWSRSGLGFLLGIVISVMTQQATLFIGVAELFLPLLVVGAVIALYSTQRSVPAEILTITRATRAHQITREVLLMSCGVLWLITPDWGWPLAFAVLFSATWAWFEYPKRAFRILATAVAGIVVFWCAWTIRELMPAKWWFFDEDSYFYAGIGRGIARFGFWDNVFITGRPFSYHWLPYGWAGWISDVTGDYALTVFVLVIPLSLATASVLLIRGILEQLTGQRFLPVMIIGACATSTLWITSRAQTPVSVTSAGTTLGHLFALALLCLTLVDKRVVTSFRFAILTAAMIVGLVGSKVHTALPILAALGAVTLIRVLVGPDRGRRAASGLAILMTIACSGWFFYLAFPSQGRINFEPFPRFDYVNTWGDMLETSPTSKLVWGLVVGAAYLAPLIVGAIVWSKASSSNSKIFSSDVLVFAIVSSGVALVLASTTQQPSGTSFFYLSFAPMLGGIFLFSQWRAGTAGRKFYVWLVITIGLFIIVKFPASEFLMGIDWRLERFRLFLLVTGMLLLSAFIDSLFRKFGGSKRSRIAESTLLLASAAALLGSIHVRNYSEMASRVIPVWSRQNADFLAPSDSEIAWSRWLRANLPYDAVLASNSQDMRLVWPTARRWYVSTTQFAKDGTEEPSRRGQLLNNFLESPSNADWLALRRDGVTHLVVDLRLTDTESPLRTLIVSEECYRNRDFVIYATNLCR